MRIQPAAPATSSALFHEPPPCDTTRRFVRVIDKRPDGLIAFEFAIGWPDLAVELLLPAQAFADFCATHRVLRLDD